MNINLSNNGLLQGMSQDPGNSFSQATAAPKTYIQLADGRYVQIAQNIQPAQHQMPTTFLVQMPYKLLDQPNMNNNQSMMQNKRFLLPSRVGDKSPQNQRFVTVGNTINTCNNLLIQNQQIDQSQIKQIELQNQQLNDYQRNMIHQLQHQQKEVNDSSDPGDVKLCQNVNLNGTVIAMDKYKEICDMLQGKKLLNKVLNNEDMVLVEFRLNQQKYQLRMTRDQKVEMEKLLISAGNQQRQMEILQVYQSEQRKNTQQRTSVVLNQIINKNASSIVCNSPQIQTLNIAKPIYPMNSVLVAVPQNQFNEGTIIQSQNSVQQSKNISMQSTVSLQNPNNLNFNARISTPQSSIMSLPTFPITPDTSKPIAKQKRIAKAPASAPVPQPIPVPTTSPSQEMKPARSRRYNNMRKILLDDQSSVLTPNCGESFEDLHDVARRLLPYHILEESKDQRFDEVDRILTDTFTELEKRCTSLKRLASAINMSDMIEDNDREHLLVKRMQLDLEMELFEEEKRVAACEGGGGVVVVPADDQVIVIEDSPECSPGPVLAPLTDDGDHTAAEAPYHTLSLVDSMPEYDTRSPEDGGRTCIEDEAILAADDDSPCNYDIQDISNDSLDWPKDDTPGPPTPPPRIVTDHIHRSEEPDLDAAIQSILF